VHNEYAYLYIYVRVYAGLHSVALELLNTYNDKIKPKMEKRDTQTRCQLFQGDFLDLSIKDWTDADIIFANSTCYDDDLMIKIAMTAVKMKKGSFFVSLTRRIPVVDFVVLEYEMQRMSWGEATIFIMQKTTDSRIWMEDVDVIIKDNF
jgi:hypothetical protein